MEAAAGLLDEASPEDRIKAPLEEETGYHVDRIHKVFEAFMSPGSVTEKLHFFVAEYDTCSKVTPGGGNRTEGEDIEVIELSIDDAIKAIEAGAIEDDKTIMLRACLHHLFNSKERVGLDV